MRQLSQERLIRSADSARAIGSGDLLVLASPALVAMAEKLCLELCRALLTHEETSVGVQFDLQHLQATKVGETIHLQASLVRTEGRRYFFEISATHREKVIARAQHQRVAVNRQVFLGKL